MIKQPLQSIKCTNSTLNDSTQHILKIVQMTTAKNVLEHVHFARSLVCITLVYYHCSYKLILVNWSARALAMNRHKYHLPLAHLGVRRTFQSSKLFINSFAEIWICLNYFKVAGRVQLDETNFSQFSRFFAHILMCGTSLPQPLSPQLPLFRFSHAH